MDHLAALELRLSHERIRLANAVTVRECELRQVWVNQIEAEIAADRAFLHQARLDEMTDDELLAALTA